MEEVIKVEAKDFVSSGIEKFSGGGTVNFEVFSNTFNNCFSLLANT